MAADDAAPPDPTLTEVVPPPRRRGPGRPFVKGQPSANPGGRTKSSALVKLKLARLTDVALRDLGRIIRSPKTAPELRAKIDMWLVDHRIGRPSLSVGGLDGQPLIPGAPAGDSAVARLFASLQAPAPPEAPATSESENAQPATNGEAERPS